MMDTVYQAVSRVYSPPVKQWKENGGKVVATLCSLVPAEVLYAGDILPVRFRGIEAEALDVANAYFGPFICSCPKALLQMICEGKYGFIDGAVITPGCDSMRRLDDCWQKAGQDYNGIVPPFLTYLGVPHKAAPYAVDWFAEELRELIRRLEKHFQIRITEDKLRHAIRTYNHGRELSCRLQALRTQEIPAISGTDAFAVSIAGTAIPRPKYNEILESLLSDLEKTPSAVSDKSKRLMVLGSVCDETSLIKLIEDAGAVVVADNLCFGARPARDLVAETGDPVSALAHWYLEESMCPRMFGGFNQRLATITDTIEQAKVDGVILQNIRFCDLHGAENGLFAKHLKQRGIACLELEREYGPLVDKGRIKMRVDAFLERISQTSEVRYAAGNQGI